MSSKEKTVLEIPIGEIEKQNKMRKGRLEKELKSWYCCPHCHKPLSPLQKE